MGLLSEQELSALLGVQARTLQKWRCTKVGPDFVRLGKTIFYRHADVEDWIACNVVATKRVMSD
jgi:predicted DNA-binding transcriptional regulator AlpA